MEVKLTNAALDDYNGDIVLRGTIETESINSLLVDYGYQRKAFQLTSLSDLVAAMKNGDRVPDIVLSMRGQKFREREGVVTLQDPTFIVDGWQRVSAARHIIQTVQPAPMRIGAMVHFGKNEDWEREQFRILNTKRKAVSPNIMLRNSRSDSPAILTLFGLSNNDHKFALHGRVSWEQSMARNELITATVLAKTVGHLHAHKGPGKSSQLSELASGLDKIATSIGLNSLRENTAAFFDIVDECWGIRAVQYKESAVHLRSTFLWTLARVFSEHSDFWRDDSQKHLFVDAPLRRKLKLFAMHDPEITRLASAGGKARDLLHTLLVEHINSGKRTKRIVRRAFEEDRLAA